jgi:large subunit ribosomal protein L21
VIYAIFRAAGYQYRAVLGEVLRLPSLDAESGSTVVFDDVLMGASDGETLIGQPRLEGAAVRAQVLRHGRADKVVVFRFKRRKNYRRKTGHRQDFTEIRVSEVDLGGGRRVTLEMEEKAKAKAKPKKAPARKKKPEAKAAAAKKPAAVPKAKKAPARKPAKPKPKAAPKKKTTAKAKTTTKAKAKETSKSKKKKS